MCAYAYAEAAPVQPKPPASLYVGTGSTVTIQWAVTNTYADGTPIPASILSSASYKLYAMSPTNPGVVSGFYGYIKSNVYSAKMPTAGNACYAVTRVVYNPKASEGAKSTTVCVAVLPCVTTTAKAKIPGTATPTAPAPAPSPKGAKYQEGAGIKPTPEEPPPK